MDDHNDDLEKVQIEERKNWLKVQKEAEVILEEVKEVVSARSTSYEALKKAIVRGLIKIDKSRES